ncbi:hypothetical protein A9Q68_06770 [Streptococcus bovimastitidis]|uniref:Glycoside hydrolase family 38 central domain-containing protein n=1 Tax=Streptococcus bovimastitidis TaxID=1856638 RepID=A0A1L8MLN8_9STRE|nr:glycoside hydrolase family 38 C-terminal domain-containing protein [Streptococcus bovimastitidis]OJF71684.1 hypothetical protein A9Q68_06770 [Streptococcus bovimastitidis]
MKFSIVAHTHWDREWHKTFEKYRVRLVDFFDDLIETLENDSDFSCFVMDGQMVVFEDYLIIEPENRESLVKLIKENRIIVGPWYTQPDEFVPSGESLIRNLLIGKELANAFHDEMEIGYLPDSFGQSAQIPQLLNGFGYNRALFWRGMTGEETASENFLWKSQDGSQVETTVLSQGYGNARDLSLDLDKNIEIIEENIELLSKTSPSGHILLMCGFDQRKIKKHLPKIISDLNHHYQGQHEFTLSSLQAYQDLVFEHDVNKEVVTGEFRKGKNMRVHVGIGMTRPDLKRKNYDVQTQLFSQTEPLSALRFLETGKYPKGLIDHACKYMLQNQAHDSICSVCTDETHLEMKVRYDKALQLASELNILAYEDILDLDGNKALSFDKFALFNLNAHQDLLETTIDIYTSHKEFSISCSESHDNLPFTLISQEQLNLNDTTIEIGGKNEDIYLYKNRIFLSVPVNGIGIHYFDISDAIPGSLEKQKEIFNNEVFENDFFTLKLESDGTFTYFDKESNESFSHLNRIIENGNAGDEYDYSPPLNDQNFQANLENWQVLVNSTDLAQMAINYKLEAPIDSDVTNRSEETTNISIQTLVTVTRHSRRIDFKTNIENTVKNHRISVSFANNKKTEKHFSEQQFGLLWRENQIERAIDWEDWQELYYPVYPQQRFTGFESHGSNMIILNKGLVTYEIPETVDKDSITIPLLTSTDYMGKQDLLYRPGRRSGLHVATPDSEMIGSHEFEYAFFAGEITAIAKEADRYQQAPFASQTISSHISERDYLCVENSELSMHALKKANTFDGLIFRIVNEGQESLKNAKIVFDKEILSNPRLVNLSENVLESQENISVTNQQIRLNDIEPNQIISIAFDRK